MSSVRSDNGLYNTYLRRLDKYDGKTWKPAGPSRWTLSSLLKTYLKGT